VLTSHDPDVEADVVLGLRDGRVAFRERSVTAADVRALYA
jgi:hypothetical protein